MGKSAVSRAALVVSPVLWCGWSTPANHSAKTMRIRGLCRNQMRRRNVILRRTAPAVQNVFEI